MPKKPSQFQIFIHKLKQISKENSFLLYSLIILLVSFFSFFFNYQNPQAPFWDENFHAAAAQKYIDGTFFVELHPPLGKLLIAAGEAMFDPNQDLDVSDFNEVDYVKEFPKGYSFLGVRFFPALLAFLSGYLFFILLYLISKKIHYSALFSGFYILNNALIVHFRGAMLDGIQMFFVLLALVWMVYSMNKEKMKVWNYLVLGLFVGLAVSVKINSLILVTTLPFLFLVKNIENIKEISTKYKPFLIQGALSLVGFFIGGCLTFGLVQYIHVGLTQNILASKGDYNGYNINDGYKRIVDNKNFWNPLNTFPAAVGWIQYQDQYNDNVPKLDETKPGENGSYPTNWVAGRKAISYRWQRYPIRKVNHNTYSLSGPTADQKSEISLDEYSNLSEPEKDNFFVVVQYLYLQVNPIAWIVSILGLVFGVALIVGSMFFGVKVKNWKLFNLLIFFAFLYAGYMFSVLTVTRVLYLYHYFIPLVFALLMAFIVFVYKAEEFENNPKNLKLKKFPYYILGSVFVLNLAAFILFMPFTYYLPLSQDEFNLRNWFPFWGLKSQN
jgi:dolichyl-phosphate-mannose--protein O-mannosyl transferase